MLGTIVVPTASVECVGGGGVGGRRSGPIPFGGERRRHLTSSPTPLLLKAALRITTRLTGKWGYRPDFRPPDSNRSL
jgi:hypothetical protein